MVSMLIMQINLKCNTYQTEQPLKDVWAAREIVAAAAKRADKEARRQPGNVSQLGRTRLRRIQKPAGRAAARKYTTEQLKDLHQPAAAKAVFGACANRSQI